MKLLEEFSRCKDSEHFIYIQLFVQKTALFTNFEHNPQTEKVTSNPLQLRRADSSLANPALDGVP